ncbi:MAG: ABC transporter substrate-binding protein [Firmicutes bacterium]|nr:ABC transporter substrate-binding protein [Bacillota bacterium]
MKTKTFQVLVVLALVLSLSMGMALSASAKTIRFLTMQQAGMTPEEFDAAIAEFEKTHPDIEVEANYVSYDSLHSKLVTSISGFNPAYDVVLVDDIWFPQFAKAGWLLDVTDRITPEMKEDIYEAAWPIVTYKGRQYGLPYLLDQMYFYYNEEMLKKAGFDAPPTTWEELVEQAKVLKEKGIVEYPIVWSWGQIEALICTWVPLLYGNGGEFFTEDGKPVFNSPEGVEALTWMVDTLKSGISNPASITYGEEDVRSTFSQGKAAFAVNWIYMYNMTNDPAESNVVGKTRISLMPAFEGSGVKSATINGSMGFAVTARSKYKEEAWELVKFLVSKQIQKKYSDHITPIWKSLAQDETLRAKQPVTLPAFDAQFPYAHVRPKVPEYLEVSKIVQLAIHKALAGEKTPQQALDDAVAEINKILK